MVVLERNEDGTPRRVTVAVWDPEEDERPGRWRLDRIVDRPRTEDDSPWFELVDEAWPSFLLQSGGPDPIKIELAEDEWFLTENWPDIRDQRSNVGTRPVELMEKMVGLLLALTGKVEPGYLFVNQGETDTWLFVPVPVDSRMLDGAAVVDRRMNTLHASDETLAVGPKRETLEEHLGKKVEQTSSSGPTKYRVWTTGKTWIYLDYSRFHPRWSMSLFGRQVASNELRDTFEKAIRGGLIVREEEFGEWTRKHSQIPKLLLGDEEIEVLRMLGEIHPVLWLDDAFTEWMTDR